MNDTFKTSKSTLLSCIRHLQPMLHTASKYKHVSIATQWCVALLE